MIKEIQIYKRFDDFSKIVDVVSIYITHDGKKYCRAYELGEKKFRFNIEAFLLLEEYWKRIC